MYNKNLLITSFKLAQKDTSAYNTFFTEAEKCLRTLVPIAEQTKRLYNEAKKYLDGSYSMDDIYQDCLISLWEKLADECEIKPEYLEAYIVNGAKYKLFDFIKKESNRSSIASFCGLDDSFDVAYEDYHDFAEEDLSSIAKNVEAAAPKKNSSVKVIQVSKNYKKVAEFDTLEEAAKETGVPKSNISACCSHKRKSAGSYLWLFSNDKLCDLLNEAS